MLADRGFVRLLNYFFFQAEDGIRDGHVTGVQTCALPILYMREIAPYMCPFMSERALTLMRCPDGVHGNYFFQKHLPNYAPEFISSFITTEKKKGILCENLESLIWFANHGTNEYHRPFLTTSHDTAKKTCFLS